MNVPVMKKLTPNILRTVSASLCVLASLLANRAGAAVTTWDPQGSNAQNPYKGSLSGTWENNSWSTSQTGQGTPQAWLENTAAQFAVHSGTGTPAFTVTMNANHTVAGMFSGPLTPNPCTVTIQGTGTMLLPGFNGFDFNSNASDPGLVTISVPIIDVPGNPGAFVGEGTGQSFLNGANTYSGGTYLGYSGSSFSGILNFNSSASFGTGGICISNTSGSICALVAEGGSAITIPNNVTNPANSAAQLHIVAPSAGGLNFTGEWDINGHARIGPGPAGQTTTISGTMKGAGGVTFINGVGSPGILALTGPNTFTGSVTNNPSAATGTLSVNSIADSGTSALGLGANLALNGGIFQYTGAGAATTTRACWLLGASTIDLPNGDLTLNGAFNSSSSAQQLTKTSAGTLTLGGSGDNASFAIKVNAGTVVLNKASDGTHHALGGASTVSGGTLKLSGTGGDQIYSGVTLTVSSGAFDMNGLSESMTSLSLSGTGISSGGALVNSAASTTSTITGTAASGITLAANASIGGVGNITVPSGTIVTGTKSLTYVGSGTLTLSEGANSYSGGTIVSSGTLLVNNASGSATGTGSVTVNSGGTLTGTGIISGATTVNAGGTLTMVDGTAGETFHFGSTLSLAGTTSLEIEEDAGIADELVASGLITLGGNLTVVQTDANAFVLGDTFQLFGGTLTGHFTSFTLPALATGLAWDTSQLGVGGDGTIKVICDGTLVANAGAGQAVCFGTGVVIGGSPTASGGSGAGTYTYSWSPALGLSSTSVANPTATPTSTTTYTVTVTDANGCTAMSSVTVTAGTIAISTQPANTAICSGSTATLSVTATGAGLSYSWANDNNGGWGNAWAASGSGSTFRSSSTDNDFGDPSCNSFSAAGDINSPVSGFALGMYGGASGDEVVTRTFTALAAGQVVSVDFDNGNVDSGKEVGFSLETSGGADVLQFYFLGGQSNYKYWDTTLGEQDTGIPFQRTGLRVQFALTSATTYGIIVTPCGGTATTFTGTYSGTIAQLKLFDQNTTGGNDYNIYFNNFLVGGYSDNADNYSGDYAGQDKGNQPIVAGNGGSTYTTPPLSSTSQYQVTVYGCGGSVLSSVATVTVNPLPSATVNSQAVCASALPATVTATPAGGTGPYSYVWTVPSGPNPGNVASFTTSVAGNYTVVVTDAHGCVSAPGAGTLTINANPTVAVNSQAICASALPATVTATPAGGTGPYSYAWTVPVGATDPGNVASFTTSVAGTYSVVVTDANGCTGGSSGTLTINANPTVAVNSQAVCASALPATVTATPAGGMGPYSYAWTVPSGPNPGNVASFTTSVAGNYSVVVTDANGCTGGGSGTLTVYANPTVAVNSQAVCASALPATVTATPAGGMGPYSYLWTVPSGPNPGNVASFTTSVAGTYMVVVTDANGCTGGGSGTLTVNANPTASAGSDQTVCANNPVAIGGSPTASGGTGPYTYSWLPTTGLDDATAANPNATITSATTYTVTVTDNNGCTATSSVNLTLVPQPELTSVLTVGTDTTLVWSSLAGQTYRVQYTTDVAPVVSWTDLTGPSSVPLLPDVTATGATATFTDTAATDPQRFYRISVVCP